MKRFLTVLMALSMLMPYAFIVEAADAEPYVAPYISADGSTLIPALFAT